MIFIGRASENDRYFNLKLKNAITKIKEFPKLLEIVKDFKFANKNNHTENSLINLASSAVSDPFLNNNPNPDSEKTLSDINSLLLEILPKLNKECRNKLISDLRGFGEGHFETFNELGFYLDLRKNKEVSSIYYANKKKGNQDFNLDLNGVEFNFEVTCLGKSRIQKMLEESFNMASEEIIKTIPKNTLLKLNVSTDLIVKEEDNNSFEIKDRLVTDYESIKGIITSLKNNFCILPKNLSSSEESLYDTKEDYRYYNGFGERIIELSKTNSGIEFLKKIKVKEIVENCFSDFMFYDANTRLVEIHSECQFPSRAELSRKKSLLKQLKNRIDYKIKEKQLKDKTNPLISLNFEDILFHNYSNEKDFYANQEFNELKKVIEETFIKNEEKEILGVLFYERILDKSRFVKNPLINISQSIINNIASLKN